MVDIFNFLPHSQHFLPKPVERIPYPNPICSQLQIPQHRHALQSLDTPNSILYKVQVLETRKVVYPLDVLDLIE